jgi:murein DD-endopeptidase MepM/ murein hydrolase activator NlpD
VRAPSGTRPRLAVEATALLAHVVVAVAVVGGLGLALLLAVEAAPGLVPGAASEEPTAEASAAPPPRGAAALAPPEPEPLAPLAGRVVAGTRAFPVAGPAEYAADHHDYPATDLFAPCGTPVLAVAAGEVVESATSDRWERGTNLGPDRGGLSVTVRGDDGVRYYGSHLATVAVQPGSWVRAGQVLGTVGDTGSAAGTGCHLHLGLSPARCPGEWFTRRGVVSPHPYLESWRAGDDADPAPAVQRWFTENGCPAEPSTYP